jgi:hypothetical protein
MGTSLGITARSSSSADALKHVHIGASAKAAASTSNNDYADRWVVTSAVQRVEVRTAHWSGPGVQPVRPIECDCGHAIGGFVENYIVGRHGFPRVEAVVTVTLGPRGEPGLTSTD